MNLLRIVILGILAFAPEIAFAQTIGRPDNAAVDRSAVPHPQPGRVYYGVALPEPIIERELAWYADVLRLSDAQLAFLQNEFARYGAVHQQLRTNEIARLSQWSGKLAEVSSQSSSAAGRDR